MVSPLTRVNLIGGSDEPMYISSNSKSGYVGEVWRLFCGSNLLASCTLSVANSSNKLEQDFVQKEVFFLSGFLKTSKMGLSNFPSAAEGVLPVLVMNTVLSVALLKNMVRSVLQVMGATWSNPSNLEDETDAYSNYNSQENARERRISITQFKSLCDNRSSVATSNSTSVVWATVECCVCLNGFQADEEVSELSCKHFFHKGCLNKWFDNNHSTCPLCRSIL